MTAPSRSSSLDLVFAALADPTRRAILERLASGEANVNALVEPFALSQPTISKHLKVLERAGLVERGRTAQFRPVRLNAAPLADVDAWIALYRRFWEQQLSQLETYVKALQQKERAKKRARTKEKPHGRNRPRRR